MQMQRFRDFAAVYAIGSVGYSAVEILWRGFTHWEDAYTSALEKMPCRQRSDYSGRIYSWLYCQFDLSYGCLGLFCNGWEPSWTNLSSVFSFMVFIMYPGHVGIQRPIPDEAKWKRTVSIPVRITVKTALSKIKTTKTDGTWFHRSLLFVPSYRNRPLFLE